MTRETEDTTILSELISHCGFPAEAAWSSRSHGDHEWQIFACRDDLGRCHLYRARVAEGSRGPGYEDTQLAWEAVERELRRLAIPFERWKTDWPNRLHIGFEVPG